jgi:hypothetical protein
VDLPRDTLRFLQYAANVLKEENGLSQYLEDGPNAGHDTHDFGHGGGCVARRV